jgi:hypothetical protein
VVTGGSGDPIPSLRFAFSQHPQLIYLVTDAGGFGDSRAVLAEIRRLNTARRTRVNTVMILGPRSDEGNESQDLLSAIATENGGALKVIRTNAR